MSGGEVRLQKKKKKKCFETPIHATKFALRPFSVFPSPIQTFWLAIANSFLIIMIQRYAVCYFVTAIELNMAHHPIERLHHMMKLVGTQG
jgi:hypothetical protein